MNDLLKPLRPRGGQGGEYRIVVCSATLRHCNIGVYHNKKQAISMASAIRRGHDKEVLQRYGSEFVVRVITQKGQTIYDKKPARKDLLRKRLTSTEK